MDDYYNTVYKEACDEFVEKRSRFIGYCKPVTDEKQAVDFINEKRSVHWDATHNVYAYVLRNGNIQRYSDDSEPQGTAGVPTLDVILKNNVVDCAVVVTRYFGGILLGGGGLVRAYSHGAKLALEAAQIVRMEKCLCCWIRSPYNHYGKVNTLIVQNGGVIDDSQFTDDVKIMFHIPKGMLDSLQKQLNDATSSQVGIGVTDEKYYASRQ